MSTPAESDEGIESVSWMEGLDPRPMLKEIRESLRKGRVDTFLFAKEFRDEILPTTNTLSLNSLKRGLNVACNYIHIPYLPIIHSPGWLLRYVLGPYNDEWTENLYSDIIAGLTVGLTLVPQGLSYASLANIQPIYGLYASVFPLAVYSIFGSSMQLAVGPVALVSLLTGQIVSQYVPNASDPAHYEEAASLAAEVALAVGTTLTILAILNLGNFIRYISHPVMSGFTSGAACVIGLNQLKNAFGFNYSGVPQQGQTGFDYNYQVMRWYRIHWNTRIVYPPSSLVKPTGAKATVANIAKWNFKLLQQGELYRNTYATQICFAIFSALIILQLLKWGFKDTAARRKKLVYKLWIVFVALAPFISVIIAAHLAWQIKHNDHYKDLNYLYDHDYNAYYLKVVGKVPSGLHILKLPELKWNFGEILSSSIPVALIAYMESYSVARRIAASRGELHILNPSQELWANGVANLLASVSSGYPVCGSFSRSSLNATTGGRTPMSSVVTMLVIIVALQSLTGTFEYIPQAALAAIIFVAVYNLISFTDLWEAWKHSKKDFFSMLFTWIFVLSFNSELGLAGGIGVSVCWVIFDLAFSDQNSPILVKNATENDGIDVIRLRLDFNFITCGRIKDFIIARTATRQKPLADGTSVGSKIFYNVTTTLDNLLTIRKAEFVDELPKAIILDFAFVSIIDLAGLESVVEIQKECRLHGVLVVIINATQVIEKQLDKFGIENDVSSSSVNIDEYLLRAGDLPVKSSSKALEDKHAPVETLVGSASATSIASL